jgi:PadR family transcriptional regulator PadR
MHPDTDQPTENWMKEAQKGYIRIAVLSLLSNKPSHGYELMKEIKERSRGFYKPTPGGVYPILRDLEKTEYIKGLWHKQNNRNIKTYRITEKGQMILKKAVIRQSEIANNINTLFQEFARDVLHIEPTTVPMPVMSNPFSAFLEKEKTETQNTEQLKMEKKKLKQHIRMAQERIDSINEKLRKTRETTN